MTAPELRDDLLQQYFDGELPPAEAADVRELLEKNEEARARLAQLGRLHDLVRLAAEELGDDVDGNALYERVEKGIESGRGLRVIGGPGRRRGIEAWRVAVPVVGLAAAAAILFVLLRPGDGAPGGPIARVDVEGSDLVEIDDTSMLVVEPPEGSEVEEVDFGHNTGTIFAVEGEAGEPIAVVWINDDEPGEAIR